MWKVNESNGSTTHAHVLGYIDLTASDEEDAAEAGPSMHPQHLEIIDLTGSDNEAMPDAMHSMDRSDNHEFIDLVSN